MNTRATLILLVSMLWTTPAFPVSPPPDGGYPNENTAEGENALFSLTTGEHNTAVGFEALYSSDIGTLNTAIGYQALRQNTYGYLNTATGLSALFNNIGGTGNTATGASALDSNTFGSYNTATGASSLCANTTGSFNTAMGYYSLCTNTTGTGNTAVGVAAAYFTIGSNNTAMGVDAMVYNASGDKNTAMGFEALQNMVRGQANTALGTAALHNLNSGSSNIAVGSSAGDQLQNGSHNIEIGNKGVATDANVIRIGTQGTQKTTFVAGISGVTVPAGVPVVVDTSGQLGVMTSSARYKESIKPMDRASEAILSLEPVKFRYKKDLDPQGIPQFGLVAEDVAKIDPALVARDDGGKPYTVRYEAVNAMLLNEFLKEHRRVKTLEATVSAQQADFTDRIAQQQRAIQALTELAQTQAAQIRQVNEDLSRISAPLLVENR